MPEQTLVDDLVQKARASQSMLPVLTKAQKALTDAVLDLDRALAELQTDPADLAAEIQRALVVRGTIDNLLRKAFSAETEKAP